MLFKVISNDKVKVLIEKDEIKSFDQFNFEDGSESAREMLASLLIAVYEHTGVNFLNSKIIIETVQGISQSFYLVITRMSESQSETDNNINDEVDMYLFRLNGIEEVIDINEIINKYSSIIVERSEVYEYRNSLYICLYFTSDTVKNKNFALLINELENVGERCRWTILNDAILREWGRIILKNCIT